MWIELKNSPHIERDPESKRSHLRLHSKGASVSSRFQGKIRSMERSIGSLKEIHLKSDQTPLENELLPSPIYEHSSHESVLYFYQCPACSSTNT